MDKAYEDDWREVELQFKLERLTEENAELRKWTRDCARQLVTNTIAMCEGNLLIEQLRDELSNAKMPPSLMARLEACCQNGVFRGTLFTDMRAWLTAQSNFTKRDVARLEACKLAATLRCHAEKLQPGTSEWTERYTSLVKAAWEENQDEPGND